MEKVRYFLWKAVAAIARDERMFYFIFVNTCVDLYCTTVYIIKTNICPCKISLRDAGFEPGTALPDKDKMFADRRLD